jgi:hypothetical protein
MGASTVVVKNNADSMSMHFSKIEVCISSNFVLEIDL